MRHITHTRLTALRPVLPRWAGTRKVKPIWILLKQETASGSGISWAICKSAPRSRQITMPAPHHSVFTGRMPFLPLLNEFQIILLYCNRINLKVTFNKNHIYANVLLRNFSHQTAKCSTKQSKKLVQSRHDLTIDQIKNMLQTQQFRMCMSIQNSVISLPCQANTDKIYHLAEQSLIYPYRWRQRSWFWQTLWQFPHCQPNQQLLCISASHQISHRAGPQKQN